MTEKIALKYFRGYDYRNIINPDIYEILTAPKGIKPCDLCDVKELCESEDNVEFLMLCGAEFSREGWYVKLKNND